MKSLVLAVAILLLPWAAHAANSYNLANGATQQITEHGVCKKVTNSIGKAIFIPTKTSTEWAAFYNASTPGITKAVCSPVCNTWISNKACAYSGTILYNNSSFNDTRDACQAVCESYGVSGCCFHSKLNTSSSAQCLFRQAGIGNNYSISGRTIYATVCQ